MSPQLCPSEGDLTRYCLGSLPAERIEDMAAHIDSCSSCSERLTMLVRRPDPLADAVRRAGQIDAYGRAPVAPPATLRDYRLDSVLGEGGMGIVYRATHMRLGRPVALKLLTAPRRLDPDAAVRFQREMRAIGALRHANIVQATDAGEIDGVPFLVMELLEGTDLSRLVRERGPLSIADACEATRQSALALQHAHEHGLVHRDVKPSNLMLTSDGMVKLLDLGLARSVGLGSEEPSGGTVVGTGELTDTQTRVGTENYMAPEQRAAPEQVTLRADLYALGRTLVFLLTGAPDRSLLGIMPAGLAKIVQHLQAERPEDRPASAADVAKALRPWCRDNDLGVLVGRPRRRRFRPIWVLAPVLALALVGGAGKLIVAELSHQQTIEATMTPAPPPPRMGTIPMTPDEARILQAEWAEFLRTKPESSEGDGMKFALIPPGELSLSLTMRAQISRPFWLGATEVTHGQFRRFINATGYRTEVERKGTGGHAFHVDTGTINLGVTRTRRDPKYAWHNPGYAPVTDNHPVTQLSHDDALAYCTWRSQVEGRTYRLPTRAELQWAARAGGKSYYPDGFNDGDLKSILEKYAWTYDTSPDRPQPVGQLRPNVWGLYDTLGNVNEMASDWWGVLPDGVHRDYQGSAGGTLRTLHGGSYLLRPSFESVSAKMPDSGSTTAGFRVLREQ